MKPRFFVDVDTQHDFCDPSGALFVAGAPAIVPRAIELIAHAVKTRALLIGSVDTHDFTAWEFAANGGPFPPHCVKGTPGWLKVPGTLPERTVFVPDLLREDHARVVPRGAQAILFEKEVYSMFANPEAEPLLAYLLGRREFAAADVEAIVFGVATDYCVKEAALGLRKRGYDVAVVTDATAAVGAASGEVAISMMLEAGCRLVSTAQVIEEDATLTRRICSEE